MRLREIKVKVCEGATGADLEDEVHDFVQDPAGQGRELVNIQYQINATVYTALITYTE